MIKTLIFDWGGVCTCGPIIEDFLRVLSQKTGGDKDRMGSVFRDLEHPYETGRITPEKFWDDFKKELNLSTPAEEIQNIFVNSYVLNREVLDYILELRKRYQTVLLTNNYEDLFSFMKQNFSLEKYFDFMFSSSDIKHKKPEREAYDHVLNKLKISPAEAVFIDDKEKNIRGAEKIGLRAILFEDLEKFKEKLSAIQGTGKYDKSARAVL